MVAVWRRAVCGCGCGGGHARGSYASLATEHTFVCGIPRREGSVLSGRYFPVPLCRGRAYADSAPDGLQLHRRRTRLAMKDSA